jgi:Protein of unknown function (DUF3300)
MKALARISSTLLLCASVALAETDPSAPRQEAMQPELDQLLAPIALYPDSLLSQILMASTYPLEVVEAAHWSKANPGLNGEDAVNAVDPKDWDPSVKALTAFPQVLAMMDERLEWTERLGDVFIAQQPQVMETVQSLRQKAYAAGNLASNAQTYVYPQGDTLAIAPASPQVVYVPYYDPWTVYGPWWWPAYPPAVWAPWPGYVVYPGFVFAWGVGVTIGPRFFFSACDWRARRITVVNVVNVTHVTVNRSSVSPRPTVWQHDPGHRRGVPYHIASLQGRLGPTNVALAAPRHDPHWREALAPATHNTALNRPETHRAPPPQVRRDPHPPVYARPAAPAPVAPVPQLRRDPHPPEQRPFAPPLPGKHGERR